MSNELILKSKYLKQAKKPELKEEEEKDPEQKEKGILDRLFEVLPEQLDPTRPNVEYEIKDGKYVKKKVNK
jgi:hypothetical protein